MLHWKFCLAPTTQSSNHRFSYFATLVIINRIAAIYAFSFFLNIQPENSLMEVSRCVWGTESFIKEETFTCSYFFFPLRISTAALWLKSHLHISAHLINREKNIQKGWIPLKWCPQMGSLKMTGCGDQNIKTSFNCLRRKKKKRKIFHVPLEIPAITGRPTWIISQWNWDWIECKGHFRWGTSAFEAHT